MSIFTKKHTHSKGLASERKAADKAKYTVGSIKYNVLTTLEKAGDYGCTPDEFNDTSGGLINTTRRRFTDLWKDGRIKHHPGDIFRINKAGNDCVVWVLGEDKNKKLSRYALMQLEIKRLKKLLRKNNINPKTGKQIKGKRNE